MLVEFFRRRVAKMLPRPKVLRTFLETKDKQVRSVIVFGRHPNPTTDYYIAGRFAERPEIDYLLVDIRGYDFEALNPEEALVIVCRYASMRAVKWIQKNRSKLAKVVLFLDDDIPAVILGSDASLSYRAFLYYRALYPLPKLNRLLDTIWVSTPRLGQNMGCRNLEVVSPAPHHNLWTVDGSIDASRAEVLVAYHATGVHYSEHQFLQPIVAKAMERRPNIRFEVFADSRTAAIWEGMADVTIRRPIPWSDYVAEAKQRCIDVMLVPLCNSEVNDCRAPTKRIDVARFGAAGVFSLSSAYGLSERDDEILLPNDTSQWVSTILRLVDDASLRKRVAEATRARVHEMSKRADDYKTLLHY